MSMLFGMMLITGGAILTGAVIHTYGTVEGKLTVAIIGVISSFFLSVGTGLFAGGIAKK